MSKISKLWTIVQFKPNAHKLAERNLNQQDFETFLPLHEITIQKTSRFVSDTKPLFPGYMFIFFDRTDAKWHKIINDLLHFNYVFMYIF